MPRFKPTTEQLFSSLKRSVAAKDSVGAQRASEELVERAFEAIENDDDKVALTIAQRLQSVQHPTGFEIEAVIHDRDDDKPKAVEVLERGVGEVPNSWRLWEMLGNLHSDAEEYEKARESYLKAINCPEAEPSSIRFNMALNHARAGNYADALDAVGPVRITEIDDDELRTNILALKASILNSLERHKDAATLARDTLAACDDSQYTEETIPHLAELHAQLSRAILEGEHDSKTALEHAQDAIRVDQSNELALQLIRSIRNQLSIDSRLIQLTLKGTWYEPFEGESECRDFRQTFAVVADSQEEALEFARSLSPEELRESLVIEEAQTMDLLPEEPKGVCQVSPYVFFSDDEEEPAEEKDE